jgi:hypothetical protein
MRFDRIKNIINKTNISNEYVLLLYLLNAAIIMNFHKFIFSHFYVSILFIFISLIAILNIKYWRILFVNFIIGAAILSINFPRIGNHSTFLMIAILVVLFLFIKKIIFNSVISKSILPYYFRIFLVIVYFYSGFHKLNDDFFNPCVSCVNEINEYNISNFTFSNYKIATKVSVFLQFATLFLELILPFGLLWHVSRKIIVILFLAFHFYLIFAGFADFASVVLFYITGCLMVYKNEKINFKHLQIYILFVILSIIIRYFLFKINVNTNKLVFYQGIIFSIGWLYFVFQYVLKLESKPTIFYKKFIPALLTIFFIISFWTLKTYIGLGNQGNLTMFSNLVTASKHHNHFLIDANKFRLFNFENDCVKFIQFTNPDNKNDSFSGYYLPMVEFQYYINHWQKKHKKPIVCIFEYQNKIYKIDDLCNSSFNNSKWWYKYLTFRRIQNYKPNKCIW